jgi:hypothetical protein
MRLLGILFSCVCLQMASGPVARAVCQDPVVQRDPEGASAASLSQVEQEAGENIPLSPLSARALPTELALSAAAHLLGPKDFLIHTGLSPPLAIG